VKYAGEVALIGEAAAHGNRTDAFGRPFEHFLGTLDPVAH
jgi:hypothetical protein